MSGSKSRTKGRRFEQWLVNWFKSHGIEARRGYQSRGGGAEQADVILTDWFWHVEAKRVARSSIYSYMEQAERDSKTSHEEPGTPVVLLKADRKPVLAIMLADDWLEEVFNE